MKNTKISTIILAVITVLSLLVDILVANAELIGIDAKIVSLIAMVVTMIKAVYDNRGLFNAQEVTEIVGETIEDYEYTQKRKPFTIEDVKNWKSNKK